jgi:hypothetical protein
MAIMALRSTPASSNHWWKFSSCVSSGAGEDGTSAAGVATSAGGVDSIGDAPAAHKQNSRLAIPMILLLLRIQYSS